ncbi:non-ribosomal peptide synthetase [Micromonospora sp. NPDC023633]|uniref:non-ribosomal peptide synthetase n=1 Tax=Micromonospora sp. NPDC023633 TaxID=3154320 RepID=UPI0033FB4AEE
MTATARAGQHRPTSVPAEVLRSARTYPERPAVVDSHRTLRYRELVTAATALAGALAPALGANGPGERTVAVLRPRTVDAVVGQLAAWFCGAAFLPLDPALPPARIAGILADAGCRVAVAAEEHGDRLPAGVTAVRAGGEKHLQLPDVDDLAYLISTSGSTGRPKQVEVAHRSLWTVLDWYATFFRLAPGVRTAAFAGLAFDAALLDLWAPLMRGATVLLADESVARDPERVATTVREVDHCFLTTPLAEHLLRAGAGTGRLRSLATGGDRLRTWPPADFGAAVHNLYGPTEATILVTATSDLRRHTDRSGPPPIGRPVAGARLTLVPTAPEDGGQRGELVVAGPVLARGYRSAPAETAAAYGATGGERHYRTGDLCRRDPDGELHFIGRTDNQVKVRGHRIELREVEFALLAMPEVGQAAAGTLDRDGQTLLVAWVVGTVDADAVRNWLRERLPAAMVPHLVERCDALPLTTNGKLDRAALRAATARRLAGERRHDAPGDRPAPPEEADAPGEAEAAVAEAWRAVLGTPPRPDDDFFTVGGDSLLAVRLTAQVRQGLRVDVRATLLYEHRRFADYLAAVEALRAGGPVAPDGVGAAR